MYTIAVTTPGLFNWALYVKMWISLTVGILLQVTEDVTLKKGLKCSSCWYVPVTNVGFYFRLCYVFAPLNGGISVYFLHVSVCRLHVRVCLSLLHRHSYYDHHNNTVASWLSGREAEVIVYLTILSEVASIKPVITWELQWRRRISCVISCYGDSCLFNRRGEEGAHTIAPPEREDLLFGPENFASNKQSLLENYKSYLKKSWTISARRDVRSHWCHFYAFPMYSIFLWQFRNTPHFDFFRRSGDLVYNESQWEPEWSLSTLWGNLRENREAQHSDGHNGWKRTKMPTF